MNQQNVRAIQVGPVPTTILQRTYFRDKEVEWNLALPSLICLKVADNPDMFGMVAIENTLVGSILANYTLLKDLGLGEQRLRIRHQLMALPGQQIEDIQKYILILWLCTVRGF